MSTDEATFMQQELLERLSQVPASIIRTVSLAADGRVLVFQGQATVRAEVEEKDSNERATCVAFHVTIGKSPVFTSCTAGFGPDRETRIKEAMDHWVQQVFGPVISVFHATPVFGAELFKGEESWGVRGLEGFAGPVLVRMQANPDFGLINTGDFFGEVEDLIKAQRFVIIKSTVTNAQGHWERFLEWEIAGQKEAYHDTAWDLKIPVPEEIVIYTRFAVSLNPLKSQ